MLKVFQKTSAEIEAEYAQREAASREQDKRYSYEHIMTDICPTYVVAKNGVKVDTYDLSENEVLSFAKQGIMKAVTQKKQHKRYTESVDEAARLTRCLRPGFAFSLKAMKPLISLIDSEEQDVKLFAAQVLYPVARAGGKYFEVYDCALRTKRGRGDETFVTKDDLLHAADELLKQEAKAIAAGEIVL